jgi:hypothetical protein
MARQLNSFCDGAKNLPWRSCWRAFIFTEKIIPVVVSLWLQLSCAGIFEFVSLTVEFTARFYCNTLGCMLNGIRGLSPFCLKKCLFVCLQPVAATQSSLPLNSGSTRPSYTWSHSATITREEYHGCCWHRWHTSSCSGLFVTWRNLHREFCILL